MPVPSGKITTTKIMQGLEKSPEPVPDKEKEIVKELSANTARRVAKRMLNATLS